jgi:hypothetical protein
VTERLGIDNKNLQPQIFCIVDFEFFDDRVLALDQPSWRLADQLNSRPPAGVESAGLELGRIQGIESEGIKIGISYTGPKDLVTKEFALEQSAYRVFGWLRDEGLPDVDFTDVNIFMGELGLVNDLEIYRENLIIEARSIQASLRQLDTIMPKDIV